MATPTRDQIIARYKETRGLDDAAAGALADAYLASKGATPTAKPAPAPKPSPVAKKSEPVAEKKASPPATRTAPAPAPAAKSTPAPAATVARAPIGPVAPPPPRAIPGMPQIRGPSLTDQVASAAKKVAEIPDAAYGAYVSGRRQSAMESANKYRNLDGTKPTIQNFTPPPPPPPPAPGRAPAGMTMSSFSGGVPSRALELGARDTSYDARPGLSPEVAARLAPAMAADEVKTIRTALKAQKPELSAQIDQLSDEQVLARKDRVAAR